MHWSVLAALGQLGLKEGGCFSAPQCAAPNAKSWVTELEKFRAVSHRVSQPFLSFFFFFHLRGFINVSPCFLLIRNEVSLKFL